MIIDTNVYLSRWPARRLPHDEPEQLAGHLKEHGIAKAWVSSFDGLLHNDISHVNARLAEDCRTFGPDVFVPFGVINPALPDWEEDVRRVAEEHRFPGIRVFPNYHRYDLKDERFARLLDIAQERQLIVQIPLKMEDERTQHPLLAVEPVAWQPLPELLAARPKLQVVLINALRSISGPRLAPFAKLENVAFEIAMLEGVGGITNLMRNLPFERILFGSYAPFFYLESALFKLRESELGDVMQRAIRRENAERVVARRKG